MKNSLLLAVVAAFALNASAAGAKSYQVTGPVLEITDAKIVVDKNGEKWEINRTADTKGAAPKVGDKVTVKYTMTAVAIEDKAEAKAEEKAAPAKVEEKAAPAKAPAKAKK